MDFEKQTRLEQPVFAGSVPAHVAPRIRQNLCAIDPVRGGMVHVPMNPQAGPARQSREVGCESAGGGVLGIPRLDGAEVRRVMGDHDGARGVGFPSNCHFRTFNLSPTVLRCLRSTGPPPRATAHNFPRSAFARPAFPTPSIGTTWHLTCSSCHYLPAYVRFAMSLRNRRSTVERWVWGSSTSAR
jgi:hypothetical protein